MTRKICNEPNCKSKARNKSDKCVAHGGGKLCNEQGCHSCAIHLSVLPCAPK